MEEGERLIELCSQDADIGTLTRLLSTASVSVDTADKDGMTALMHAAYRGNVEVCRKLLEHNADINWNGHKEGYTALMFATIAGHSEVVRLLLDQGARTSVVNNFNKTAAQLGAFVGQHHCVRLINNHFSITDLEHYTTPQGLEKTPKLDPSNATPLHKLIAMHTLHPVKIIKTLESSSPELLSAHSSVCRVLELLGKKMEGEGRETHSLKMHCIRFTIERCAQKGTDAILKLLLAYREDGVPEALDRFLRQCLQEYPHIHSQILKQMVATLAKTPPGGPPSAFSLLQQMIFGHKSESEEKLESCSVCEELIQTAKKCSRCKQAYYCGVECQTLAWTVGNHRKLCKMWMKEESKSKQSNQPPTTTPEA